MGPFPFELVVQNESLLKFNSSLHETSNLYTKLKKDTHASNWSMAVSYAFMSSRTNVTYQNLSLRTTSCD